MAGLDPAIHEEQPPLPERSGGLPDKPMNRNGCHFCAVLLAVILSGCATASGVPVARIPESGIAAAYLPLSGRIHLGLDRAAGAAVMINPGIAVTNAHNANLLDPKSVIGVATKSDLMFFHAAGGLPPATAAPQAGEAVTAYGQDLDGRLRLAHGVVRQIVKTPGYDASPYFIFSGDAGPGFSGGPVVDASGKLIGITFGYKDQGRQRLIYAYDLTRVLAELSLLQKTPRQG
jgi:Trypsin-like peptidase domain